MYICDVYGASRISKSNCAFVNYKSGTALLDAMKRFDESRFNGVRLVCRLRRGSASALTGNSDIPAIPMGPTQLPPGLVDGQTQELEGPSSTPAPDEEDTGAAKDVEAVREQQTGQGSKDRYFIVKSLTTQDLDTSLRTGIWATQSHNESVLNDAFKVSQSLAGHERKHQRWGSHVDKRTECGPRLPRFLRQQIRELLWLRSHGLVDIVKRNPAPRIRSIARRNGDLRHAQNDPYPRDRMRTQGPYNRRFCKRHHLLGGRQSLGIGEKGQGTTGDGRERGRRGRWRRERGKPRSIVGKAVQGRVAFDGEGALLPDERDAQSFEREPRDQDRERRDGIGGGHRPEAARDVPQNGGRREANHFGRHVSGRARHAAQQGSMSKSARHSDDGQQRDRAGDGVGS